MFLFLFKALFSGVRQPTFSKLSHMISGVDFSSFACFKRTVDQIDFTPFLCVTVNDFDFYLIFM